MIFGFSFNLFSVSSGVVGADAILGGRGEGAGRHGQRVGWRHAVINALCTSE